MRLRVNKIPQTPWIASKLSFCGGCGRLPWAAGVGHKPDWNQMQSGVCEAVRARARAAKSAFTLNERHVVVVVAAALDVVN